MRKIFLLAALIVSITGSLLFLNSCDVNAPLDIELIQLSTDELEFGVRRSVMSFEITNTDTLYVFWQAQLPYEWLTIEPSDGSLEPNVPDTIIVTVDRSILDPGEYRGDINLEFDATTEALIVGVQVLMQSELVIDVPPIEFAPTDSSFSFTIENHGSIPLEWECLPEEPWVVIEPSSGVIPPDSLAPGDSTRLFKIEGEQEVKVSVDRTQLPPGNHQTNIFLNTNGGSDTLNVSVEVSADPQLGISTTSLVYTDEETSKTVTLSNDGGGIVNWTASTEQQWITVSPASGELTSEVNLPKKEEKLSKINERTAQVDITVDKSGMDPGSYEGTVSFNSNGGNKQLNITVRIDEDPVISITNSSTHFGETGRSGSIEIANSGTGTLQWSAGNSESWLTISPTEGSITTGTQTISLSVDRTGLQPGNYSDNVSFTSNGGNPSVEVTMTVPEPQTNPELSYSPSSLDFGNQGTNDSFAITNLGEQTLTWSVSTNEAWINITPNSGSTDSESDQVSVTVSREGLEPGDYSGTISIATNGGEGSVAVSMTVDEETPVLSYSPTSIDLNKENPTGAFAIQNTGKGELNWNLSTDQPWLTVIPESGMTTTEPVTIDVSATPDDLPPGTYNGNVNITSDGGDGTVAVTLTIPELIPQLSYTPESMTFSVETDSSQTLTISNLGEGALNWQLSPSQPWIQISELTGITDSNDTEIHVGVDLKELESGSHTGQIDITSDGGDGVVIINAQVPDPPVLNVSTNYLDFGNSETDLTFDISNAGADTLKWECREDYLWFDLSPKSGEATTEIDAVAVNVGRGSLAPGTYQGFITVVSNGGEETVEVNAIVDPEPQIYVSQTNFDFGYEGTSNSFYIENEGSGILDWGTSITYGPENSTNYPWLYISPEYGNTEGQDMIYMTCDRGSLPANDYTATINFESNGGNESVYVKMKVAGSPVLTVSTHLLDFGEYVDTLSFNVTNTGQGVLDWLASGESWFSISPNDGSITNEQVSTITVAVTRGATKTLNKANRMPGTIPKEGKLAITAGAQTDTIAVKMLEPASPVLSINSNYFYFADPTYTQDLKITNTGTGTLSWSISTPPNWLSYSTNSGATAEDITDTIVLSVDSSVVSSGFYSDTLQVSSDGGNQNITVDYYKGP